MYECAAVFIIVKTKVKVESYHCTNFHMWMYEFLKNINHYKKRDVELGLLPSIENSDGMLWARVNYEELVSKKRGFLHKQVGWPFHEITARCKQIKLTSFWNTL